MTSTLDDTTHRPIQAQKVPHNHSPVNGRAVSMREQGWQGRSMQAGDHSCGPPSRIALKIPGHLPGCGHIT